jgi:Ti-type conjugative transfer relaxase TraA
MAIYHFVTKPISRSGRNTVRAIAYRSGCELYDEKTGQTFNYTDKPVQHVELVLPQEAPEWAKNIQKLIVENREKGVQALVDIVEGAENRVDSRVWREFEFSLHRELTQEQNMTLARAFVQDQLSGRGMAAKLNFHFDVDEETGEENPHCHVTAVTRRLEENGLSLKKEREWNTKPLLLELREQWENYSNFYFKLFGHDIQIDHRSNKERGIDMEPQPKRGKGVIELEKRLQKLEGNIEETIAENGKEKEKASPITDRIHAFHNAQLRNLYRVIRNPDVILDIVSKHHSTFMWADVQKKLHQYVDNPHLFERLEAKLQQSSELVFLRREMVKNFSDISHEETIYTTRSMLKAEMSLIEQAEDLGKSKTHGVKSAHTEAAIAKANEKLKKHGGLSEDQIKAIHHLVDEGQIKCVVGIAGAGKTTAIGVCHEIWKAEGYAVYGLAPTGKASQNLEGSSLEDHSLESNPLEGNPLEENGIPSTTLHKFLKSFKEGRCQYNKKSVLVLDEAGMVDVERFDKLLSAAKQLGVKLIIVGDGAQLQPVEAGPAFRLVTEKLGLSELNTVIRQKEDWQKEATVLFGQQKTNEAIQRYADKGCVHIVEEKLPLLNEVISNEDYDSLVHLYEVSHRVSSLIYREMARDVQRKYPELKNLYSKVKEHEDFKGYLEWKARERDAAGVILQKASLCLPALEARRIDTLKLALVFKDNRKDKFSPQEEGKERATALLKNCGLDHLIGVEKESGKSIDVRKTAKEELIHAWHKEFKEDSTKSSAILAFSNRDVNDLNRQARTLLKDSGHLSKEEFTFNIKKEIEDDFGRKYILQEKKGFSKGDRIVFTKNKYWSGLRNGTMGTITDLNAQKIQVKLDDGKDISFAPNLNPHFDHGWAVTIHKSQGTTVDQSYVLASYEMNQNLAYVSMTRHRETVKLFGSSLDFWRADKLPEVLSKSGEKLSAADYLDAEALTKIMIQDDQLITKFFQRISNELEAMGAVTKQAFWNVADHFLGMRREKEIRVFPDSIREDVRAEELLKGKTEIPQKRDLKAHEKQIKSIPFLDRKEAIENALKENISDFADHVFASIGADYNRAMSSKSERRYGTKGEFSVNLQKGLWCSYKDAQLAGGPLHLLTQLKNLSFKEAIDYGASWARLSPNQVHTQKHNFDSSYSQKSEKENLKKEVAESKQKIERAQKLWAKGQPIQGTIAERYLKEHRKIVGELSQDFRYLSNVKVAGEQSAGKTYPCLMVAARSNTGDITAVQLTFLDSKTANKADVPVQKRSYGLLKGSAVTIQAGKDSNLLFIAEGVETALSLKAAGIEGTIKASLGLSNIARIEPQDHNTHIVICGDHDAPNSPAVKSLQKSVQAFQERGFKVSVIKPDTLGEDFNDILKKQGPKSIRKIIKQAVPQTLKQSSVITKEADASPQDVFNQITKSCEKVLYTYMANENIFMTPELKERILLQADRAANFIFYAHTLNGSESTEKETKHFLARAKYELDRIPHIKEKLTDEWHKRGKFDEQKDPLFIHMIAERQASIEGRLYLEAKQEGIKPSTNIPQLAEAEFKAHRAEAKILAQKLGVQYSLSENAASECAKNILRYQETHGTKPTDTQMTAMSEIAHQIEEKYPDSFEKDLGSHNLIYLRRMNGDSMFRERCYESRHSIAHEQEMFKIQEKALLEVQKQHIENEISRQKEREFSMSM